MLVSMPSFEQRTILDTKYRLYLLVFVLAKVRVALRICGCGKDVVQKRLRKRRWRNQPTEKVLRKVRCGSDSGNKTLLKGLYEKFAASDRFSGNLPM